MRFCSLSSGSDGNCQYIEHKNTKILIDAGHSGKRIKELLSLIDINIEDIDAVFVTHEHMDHCKGVGVISRRHNIKVFANENTFKAMSPFVKKISLENAFQFNNGKAFQFKDLFIEPMPIFHDCLGGTSFIIHGGKEKICIITDTGWISASMMEKAQGSDLFYLEANHDLDMLIGGTYTWAQKQRIMSNEGHLSNENAGKVLSKLLRRKKEKILLAHLSLENNTPERAKKTVKDLLLEKNLQEGRDYFLEAAPRYLPSNVYEWRKDEDTFNK